MRQTTQNFQKGIDDRYDLDKGGEDRLFTLQNARINERGKTFSVTRIQGIVGDDLFIDDDYVIVDLLFGFGENDLFVYYTKQNQTIIAIYDFTDPENPILLRTFDVGEGVKDGEMVRKNNIIYLSPINKMINYIEEEYYLNDTVGEYPKIKNVTIYDTNLSINSPG